MLRNVKFICRSLLDELVLRHGRRTAGNPALLAGYPEAALVLVYELAVTDP